jgi:hypothetical protein
MFGVFVELGYITVLFSKLARWIFPVLAAGTHIGIWVLLGASFHDLIILQLAVFPLEQLWYYVTSSLSSASRQRPSLSGIEE